MNEENKFKKIFQPGIIVSCQAHKGEPLYREEGGVMSLMALAAQQAGAVGIRANDILDCSQILETVSIPVLGILKKHYPDSDIYITPTMEEVDALMNIKGMKAIAVAMTDTIRPNGLTNEMFIKQIREKYPDVAIMADIANIDEGIKAWKLGVDCVATTLYGHLPHETNKPSIDLVRQLVDAVDIPVVCEGGIYLEQHITEIIKAGAYCCVVGGSITRPKEITKRYVEAYKSWLLKQPIIHQIDRQPNRFRSVFKPGIIVSCQAQKGEPMYRIEGGIMSLMALAAQQAGAIGIRANTVIDCLQISETVSIPVLGIYKNHYPDSPIYITATMSEVDALMSIKGMKAIAVELTDAKRPFGQSHEDFIHQIRSKYPDVAIMADIATYEEGIHAWKLGVDCVATTMYGYTTYDPNTPKPNIELVRHLVKAIDVPVVCEGGIYLEQHVVDIFEAGAYCCVIGGSITRPKEITTKFIKAYENAKHKGRNNEH